MYATYLKNRSPTRAIKDDKTPYDILHCIGNKPNITNLQEFGNKYWVLQQDKKRSELEQFIFTGLTNETCAWRYYNATTRNILMSRRRNVIIQIDVDNEPDIDDEKVLVGTSLEGETDNNGEQVPDDNESKQFDANLIVAGGRRVRVLLNLVMISEIGRKGEGLSKNNIVYLSFFLLTPCE